MAAGVQVSKGENSSTLRIFLKEDPAGNAEWALIGDAVKIAGEALNEEMMWIAGSHSYPRSS